MNKSILVIVLVAAAVVGAGVLMLTQTDDATLARRAVQGNGEATCTFTDPETAETGTLHIKDGDMRATATVETPELEEGGETSTTVTHALIKDDTTYLWSEGETQGLMFPEEQLDELDPESEETFSLKDLDEEEFRQEFEENDFSCSRGVEDGLMDLPEDVDFIDFSTFQQNLFDNVPTE